MANKPVGTITNESPLNVHVNKNGRPVKVEHAKAYVEKHFPNVVLWEFIKTDHSILAKEIPQ